MSESFEYTNEYRLSLIRLLLQLSASDQNISSEEQSFIARVASNFNIQSEEFDQIVTSPLDKKLELPQKEEERMSILYYLLFLMKADQEISEQEILIIRKIAFRLGFQIAMVDEMIQVMQKYKKHKIAPEKLLNTIKKYMN